MKWPFLTAEEREAVERVVDRPPDDEDEHFMEVLRSALNKIADHEGIVADPKEVDQG